MPRVSVLMCAYNAYPYVVEAVQSVLDSSFPDFQFLIVNDGSTDTTSSFLRSMNDPRIEVVELESNCGIARAANIGLEKCTGEYIVRFDADDVMHPDRIQKSIDFLDAHPEVDVVCSKVELTEASFQQDGYVHYVEWTNSLLTNEDMLASRFRDSPIVNPSVCFRRSIIEECGAYNVNVPEDYEFWMRLWSKGVKFHKVNETLLTWRDHSNRLTRNHIDYEDGAFFEVKLKYFVEEWRRVSNGRKLFHWGKNKNAARWQSRLNSLSIDSGGFIDFQSGEWKGLPLLDIQTALEMSNAFFLIHVRDRKGGALIREALLSKGFVQGEDFYFT
ncbi:MAG: glycosyltransferase [Flavobacteriia bacterium]|nr:glycosyltransferase [Flavobacteriia bacterium]